LGKGCREASKIPRDRADDKSKQKNRWYETKHSTGIKHDKQQNIVKHLEKPA